ncbi:MAG: hypothetical protein PHV85_11265, partial [Desulfovibrionaceae bacterium]|nr:hypothetical protein [Desulfovibrionaceae bacterium]
DEAPRLGRPCWVDGHTGAQTAWDDLALAAHQALHQTGWGLYSFGQAAGQPCLLALDGQPNLAPNGLFRQSLAAAGLSFAQAVTDYLNAGLARYQQETSLRCDYKDRV